MKNTTFLCFLVSSAAFLGFDGVSRAESEAASKTGPAPKQEAVAKPDPAAKPALLTDEERKILDEGEISKGGYIGGGIVGSVIGFGTGHLIQGHARYLHQGWKFTVGEAVGAGVWILGAHSCSGSGNAYNYSFLGSTNCSSGSVSTVLAGSLIFFGVRVWQILDLWLAPPELNERYRLLRHKSEQAETSYYLIPVLDGSKRSFAVGLSRYF